MAFFQHWNFDSCVKQTNHIVTFLDSIYCWINDKAGSQINLCIRTLYCELGVV